MHTVSRSKLVSGARIALLGLVFGIAYTQSPLYTSNQNSYFLHGLAQAGLGSLNEDWTSGTSDPFPLFSHLVRLTYGYSSELVFHLYYLILLGTYIYAVWGIAGQAGDRGAAPTRSLACFTALVAAHSAALGFVSSRVLGFDPRTYFWDGLAGQYLLGHGLQPSVFGVFLVVSIHSFLQDRPIRAVACSVVAAVFHPTYVLGAASLILSYGLAMSLTRRRTRDVLFMSGVGSVSLALIAGSVLSSFGTVSAEATRDAQSILVDHRIPHHTVVAQWFGKDDAFRLLVVAVALALVSKKRRVFVVLLVPSLIGLVLTVTQVVTGNKALALLFPWRSSVFLVPLSSALIIARIVAWAASRPSFVPFQRLHFLFKGFLVGTLVLLAAFGVLLMNKTFSMKGKRDTDRMMDYVAGMRDHDVQVLIPLELATFRLRTGVPTFVDFKTHPYRGDEVLEWYERCRVASAFYEAGGTDACSRLRRIRESYGVTHVVLPHGSELRCDFSRLLYGDDRFEVHDIAGDR